MYDITLNQLELAVTSVGEAPRSIPRGHSGCGEARRLSTRGSWQRRASTDKELHPMSARTLRTPAICTHTGCMGWGERLLVAVSHVASRQQDGFVAWAVRIESCKFISWGGVREGYQVTWEAFCGTGRDSSSAGFG
jgi:hypothetical protein